MPTFSIWANEEDYESIHSEAGLKNRSVSNYLVSCHLMVMAGLKVKIKKYPQNPRPEVSSTEPTSESSPDDSESTSTTDPNESLSDSVEPTQTDAGKATTKIVPPKFNPQPKKKDK